MADDPTLFRARAAAEQANADAAQLDNVRDRCTRAANAWTEMADRAERTLAQRIQREAATAAKVAAVHAGPDDDDAMDDAANRMMAAPVPQTA